jgi:hypothetical protein
MDPSIPDARALEPRFSLGEAGRVGASEGAQGRQRVGTAVGGLAGPDDARRLVLGLGVCLWVHVVDQKEQTPDREAPIPGRLPNLAACESLRLTCLRSRNLEGWHPVYLKLTSRRFDALPGRLNCKGLPSNRSTAVWPCLALFGPVSPVSPAGPSLLASVTSHILACLPADTVTLGNLAQ